MLRVALTLLGAGALAWFTYWRLERLGRRAWLPATARAVAWAALGLLVLDLSCATSRSAGPPLVLLDASLSMTAAGGQWAAAREAALAMGEVRRFGDRGPAADSLPALGRSDLEPALRAAAASDRRVMVVTDGELSDPTDLPAELLARAGVVLFPRATAPDLAIARVSGPLRVTAGDTVRLEVEARAFGGAPDTARVEARVGARALARAALRLGGGGAARVVLAVPTAGLAGDVTLTVALAGQDAEPRNDSRLFLLRVSPTPGIVLLASPPDWDSRFLYQALQSVADLPIRGYLRLEGGAWRAMEGLATVPLEEVRQAARQADVLVLKGNPGEVGRNSGARGRWLWPSGEGGESSVAGDWYAAVPGASPVAGAFVGVAVDSFPPLVSVTPIEPPAGAWIGLTAQLGRRGAERAAFTGGLEGNRRVARTAADGLWRWAFRGGTSEQAYRAMVAGTLSWLLGAADSSVGRARLARPVASHGRPVVFEWAGGGTPRATGISLAAAGAPRTDTLRFDGAGQAELWLPPGVYPYQLEGGGRGTFAVDTWSEEWLPRPVRLAERPMPEPRVAGTTSARNWPWLFLLTIAALAVEWLARRRLGLR